LEEGFLEASIILMRLVEVRNCTLENILNNSFYHEVFLRSELRMVEVSDGFQDDIFLQNNFIVIFFWVDAYLPVDNPALSLSKWSLLPEAVIKLASLFALWSYPIFIIFTQLNFINFLVVRKSLVFTLSRLRALAW
jgi:hypothetical protein